MKHDIVKFKKKRIAHAEVSVERNLDPTDPGGVLVLLCSKCVNRHETLFLPYWTFMEQ